MCRAFGPTAALEKVQPHKIPMTLWGYNTLKRIGIFRILNKNYLRPGFSWSTFELEALPDPGS